MTLTDLLNPPRTNAQRNKQILVLAVLTVLCLLPYIQKPIHIDDHIFMDIGEKFSDVKSFYKTPYYYFGNRYESVIDTSHPPLVPLIDFVITKTFPHPSEAVFHGVYLVFAVLAVLFTYLFCLQFSVYPFLISLCLLFSPPFFILSQSLMTDIVLYCFILGSLVFYIKAVNLGHKGYLGAAAGLFALAIGTGYQALIFYAAFFIYSCLHSPKRFSYFWIMGISVVPLMLWYAYHFSLLHQLPQPFNMEILDEPGRRAKLLYFISQLSLAFLVPIGLIVAVVNRKHVKTAVVAGIVTWVTFDQMRGEIFNDYSTLQKWVLYSAGFFTIFFLAWLITQLYQSLRSLGQSQSDQKEFLFLALMVLIFLPICVVFTPFAASRYLLPIMPFIYVLILRMGKNLSLALTTVTLAVCVVFSFSIARADYNFAYFYKRFANEVARFIPEKNSIWFDGEWGFRHYMRQLGYRYLAEDSDLKEHDLIIEPSVPARMDLSLIKTSLRLKKDFIYPGDRIKLLHHQAHAGFWSQGWGLLPAWPSRLPMETIRVYEVMPEVIPFNLLGLQDQFIFSPELNVEKRILGGEAREVLVPNREQVFTLSFTPEKHYRLQFGMGLAPRTETPPGVVLFRIFAKNGEKRSVLFQRELRTDKAQNNPVWHDAEIDLEKFQGHPLNLTFEVSGDFGTKDLPVFWSSLNLVEIGTLSFK